MAAIDTACKEWREREAAQLGEELIQRIWRKVEDKGLQKGGQGLEGVCQEVVAEVWRERSGDANKLQIGEGGQTCADEVRWYERGERAKERLEEWEQMVARGGEKQSHSLKVSWEEGEEERTVRVEYGGWEKAWKVSASGRGTVDRREQERGRAESRREKKDRKEKRKKDSSRKEKRQPKPRPGSTGGLLIAPDALGPGGAMQKVALVEQRVVGGDADRLHSSQQKIKVAVRTLTL